ncbi:ABC transporter ATP-binding protein [Alloyangia pacifica]|uniref:Amino acid/amide ABC transporter ATP-binding protein 1, HAAT family n=1 Tax=Alloyangia pacifica TaxID=311180 RepID=A0A1I6WFY3_9RHOB|nr:ABC transporter ATP-binding protein [Alloyangia pacifica]SDI72389.1 amino acid/amide ABC transporter ATP-binding protein 1, HAAT family [Alloyangia pacifica]SFT24913.1 amino acid/amide ABC transporter ATP-binding protein 1, HAAT family [Alloyangia pacifica]
MTLRLENLSQHYGGLQVIQDVSLEIDVGDITGMIGPNGAGKTTLFSLINGLQRPAGGTVVLNGNDITRMKSHVRVRQGLGWTFQVPRPFSHLTVFENLLVAAREQPGDTIWRNFLTPGRVAATERNIAAKAEEILEFLKLQHVRESHSKVLSGGQKKLLELGRALMLDPVFILLDEPFAGVNPVLIEEIGARISELRDRGIGFLIIEHNIGALARLCDRMVVLDRGKIIGDGAPSTVLADKTVRLAYLGESA